jgi:hypothetical protein
MIFPARKLHLFWGFSMAMLNNQMVIHMKNFGEMREMVKQN